MHAQNPYQPTPTPTPTVKRQLRLNRNMLLATMFIAAPFLSAMPLRYWVFNHAGSWFVSTDLSPDHRAAFLGLMYIPLLMSLTILCFFPAAVLLWRERFLPLLSGIAAILLGIMLIPAIGFIAIGISSYLRHGLPS